jgi:hypothetical protein
MQVTICRSGPGRRLSFARLAVVVLALTAMVVGSAVPAKAHFFGYDGAVGLQANREVRFSSDEDNTDHFLYWNHFVHHQQIIYDQYTVLTMVEQPRWFRDGLTDFMWFASAINPVDAFGYHQCRRWTWTGNKCAYAVVVFNERMTRQLPTNTAFHVACHEIGHSYGFWHKPLITGEENSCMAPPKYDQNQTFNISGHMIQHINDSY